MGKHLVFVYGTLKSGHTRSSAMREERYIGIARTAPKYTIFQYGSYPALVEGSHCIFGELYEVSDAGMLNIDEIEGTSHGLFQRKEIELENITITQLPVDESVWGKLAKKVATAYLFKDLNKLNGARDCGSMWTTK